MSRPPNRIGNLSRDRQQLLNRMLSGQGVAAERLPIPPRRHPAEPAPLSRGQQALYFAALATDSPHGFHLPSLLRLRGPLDHDALSATITDLARRHEILRTVFPIRNGEPVQRVLPEPALALTAKIIPPTPDDDREVVVREHATRTVVRAFDLANEPPWRAELMVIGPDDHLLVLVFHHLLWDGWSIGVFSREWEKLYRAHRDQVAIALPAPACQFADYAVWEKEGVDDSLELRIEWFRARLNGLRPLALPFDRERGTLQSHHGSAVELRLPEALVLQLDTQRKRRGASLFTLLFASFAVLLARHSGDPHPVIGTPMANRTRTELEDAIGPFANLLAVPVDTAGNPKFLDFLDRVNDRVNEVQARQNTPFEAVVNAIGGERDPGYNPLFQVTFALHQELLSDLELPDLEVTSFALERNFTPFDLAANLWRRGDTVVGELSFNRELFDATTIESLTARWLTLLEAIAAQPGSPILELEMLPPAERAWLDARASAAITLPPTLQTDMACVRVLDSVGGLAPPGVRGRLEIARELTTESGHWRADGSLRHDGTLESYARLAGRSISLSEVARILRRVSGVHGAQVANTAEGIVAYVVAAEAVDRGTLRAALAAFDPNLAHIPVVAVDRIPLDAAGRADEAALARLPRLDSKLLAEVERKLASEPEVREVRALLEPIPTTPTSLHLRRISPATWAPPTARHRTTQVGADIVLRDTDRRAVASGPRLDPDPTAPTTLNLVLARAATTTRESPRGVHFVSADGCAFRSYEEIYQRSLRVAGGLRQQGVGVGDHLLLQLPTLEQQVVAFWGAILTGARPTTVAIAPTYEESNAVVEKLWGAARLLGAPKLVTTAALEKPIRDSHRLTEVETPELDLLTLEDLLRAPALVEVHHASASDTAYYQLSSGSTGQPKCIAIRHGGAIHQMRGAGAANEYSERDVFFNWLPMDHVIATHTLHTTALFHGADQVLADTSWVLAFPRRWLDLVEQHRVAVTAGPHFICRLLSDAIANHPEGDWDLSSLRILINGGEQVTLPSVLDFVRRGARFGLRSEAMQSAFGMAEACTGVTYRRDFRVDNAGYRVRRASLGSRIEDADASDSDHNVIGFTDLGPPMPGVEIRIADHRNRTLPERVIGQLQIRGPAITPGYLGDDHANASAFAADGWFVSGDLGFLRDGRLAITGREKEQLNVRGVNLHCHEVEHAVSRLAAIDPTRVAVTAVETDDGEEGLAVFYVPLQPPLIDGALAAAIRAEVGRRFGITPSALVPLTVAEFPRTTSGKLRRSELQRTLGTGDFEARLAAIDLELGGDRTLPDWFHRQIWIRRDLVARDRGGFTVIVGGDEGLSNRLREALEPNVAVVRRVADLRSPLARESGATPDHVVFLAGVGAGLQHDDDPLGDLLTLAQTLGMDRDRPLALVIATTGVLGTSNHDPVNPARGALRGLARTIALEWPRLEVRLVDLTAAAHATAVRQIGAELDGDGEPEVAWRDDIRLVPRFEAAPLGDHPKLPFRSGQRVLVTGGLGGIAQHLTRYLLVNYQARVLLIGRGGLDASDDDAVNASDALAPRPHAAARRAALSELSALGGDVIYQRGDVADHAAMATAIGFAEAKWEGPIELAFHLAGEFPSRLLAEETPERLAATIRPKLAGAMVLEKVLGCEVPIVAFSSVAALVGSWAGGAYAAASSALLAWAADRRKRGGRAPAIAWTQWDDVGMSRGFRFATAARARGHRPITRGRGLRSLLVALQSSAGELTIGLDPTSAAVSSQMRGAVHAREQVVAWCAPTAGSPTSVIRDAASLPVSVVRHEISELPRRADGSVDDHALAARNQEITRPEGHIAPRTHLERLIASVWREVLKREEVGIEHTFFALGGQSIQLVQVIARLEAALAPQRAIAGILGKKLTVVELFRHPTIQALAHYLTAEPRTPRFTRAAARIDNNQGPRPAPPIRRTPVARRKRPRPS